jgi:hypothetical protein
MAKTFIRNAFNRVVEARQRQVSRCIHGAMINLDTQSLQTLGTSREELRAQTSTSYVF